MMRLVVGVLMLVCFVAIVGGQLAAIAWDSSNSIAMHKACLERAEFPDLECPTVF